MDFYSIQVHLYPSKSKQEATNCKFLQKIIFFYCSAILWQSSIAILRPETEKQRNLSEKIRAAAREIRRYQVYQKGIMMKNLFSLNHVDKTIVASKTTLRKAGIFGSAEYKELMHLLNENSGYAVAEKVIKKSTGKKTYRGLTAALIRDYLSIQPNCEEMNTLFNQAWERGGFSLGRKWFLESYKDFNVESAKQEIQEAKLVDIRTTVECTSSISLAQAG